MRPFGAAMWELRLGSQLESGLQMASLLSLTFCSTRSSPRIYFTTPDSWMTSSLFAKHPQQVRFYHVQTAGSISSPSPRPQKQTVASFSIVSFGFKITKYATNSIRNRRTNICLSLDHLHTQTTRSHQSHMESASAHCEDATTLSMQKITYTYLDVA